MVCNFINLSPSHDFSLCAMQCNEGYDDETVLDELEAAQRSLAIQGQTIQQFEGMLQHVPVAEVHYQHMESELSKALSDLKVHS